MENYDFSKLLPNVEPLVKVFKGLKVQLTSKKALKYWLHRLHPGHIGRLGRTCKYWDAALTEALNNPKSLRRVSNYTIALNDVKIWVCNYPYSYGYEYNGSAGDHRLPSRKNVVLLKMVVDELDDKLYREKYKL